MITIGFVLFKESGKYAYGGKSQLPDNAKIWYANYVQLVDQGQNEVHKGSIMSGNYTLVTYDLPEHDNDPAYKHFFLHMFTPTRIRELNEKVTRGETH